MVLLAACLIMFTPTYAQMQMAPLAPTLMSTYGIDEAQYMSIYSSPQIMPAILSFVAGILLDRFGTKKCVLIASLLATIGIVARVFVVGYVPLYCATMMFGFTTSFIVTGSTKLVSRFFPMEKVGTAVGILYASATIAGLAAMATTAYFATTVAAFTVSAAIAVVAILAWFFLVPAETPDELSRGAKGEQEKTSSTLKSVFGCKDIYLILLAFACVGVMGFTLAGILPTVLGSRGMNAADAGLMASVLTLGQLVGCVLMAPILSKVKNEKAFLCAMAIILGVLFPCVMLTDGMLLGIVLFAVGFLSYGLTPIFLALPVRYEKIGPMRAGTAGGLLTTFQSLASAFLPGTVIIPLCGGNWMTLFVIMTVLSAIVFACALFIKFPKVQLGKPAIEPMPTEQNPDPQD